MSEREKAEKKQALAQILTIAEKYSLTAADITAAFNKKRGGALNSSMAVTLLFSYIGGAFIFAGIAIYVGLVWDELNSAARVIITFGPGLIAFIMGIATLSDKRFEKASIPLFLISAIMQPAGLGVFLNEYFVSQDATIGTMIITGTMTVQQGLAFAKTKKTTLLFFSLFFFFSFIASTMLKLDFEDEVMSALLGFSMLLVSYGISKTTHRIITPFGYFIGATFFATGCFGILEDFEKPWDVLLIGIATVMIYTSVLAQSRTYLFVSVITLLSYLGYFTDEYFKDLIGWPIALIILGGVQIVISAFAVKLGQKMRKPA